MELKNNLKTKTGWEIIEKSFDPQQLVTTGSNFMIGNGYMGYRGTFEEWQAEEFVACIVTDTWDLAKNSKWSELCNVPNGLFAQLYLEDEMLNMFDGHTKEYYRALDMRYGLNQRRMHWSSTNGHSVTIETEKFASLANHHLLVMQYRFIAHQKGKYRFVTGIDSEVWSINGAHFKSMELQENGALLCARAYTHELHTQIVVNEGITIKGKQAISSSIQKEKKRLLRELVFEMEKDEQVTVQKIVAIVHSNETENVVEMANHETLEALKKDYQALKEAHQERWDTFWNTSDIAIEGSLEAQVLARFNSYQAYIATPTHANLPIGARGLSCQVYQGAAFWDQETFNLPMYVYTHPEIAKKLVMYRYDTLPGAKRKAKRLGYYGAFYAWTSGKTGDELFPDYFFTDVLTGRPIRNHFNCWQIHVSPDVAYGVWLYYEATQDWDFMLHYGAEVLFEVAQFLVSRVHFKKDKNRYEIIRLLGPDEYHENVDNNAYTNYLTKYTMEKACMVYEKMNETYQMRLSELMTAMDIDSGSVENWKDIAARLYIPQPDLKTKVIEQFDGYFQLEDIAPDEVRKRLLDPNEYWGWPNGIAVHTQVLKQADVIQLMAMLDEFTPDELIANYEYYEPRTEHGSSLSPSVHALVACKAGHHEEAYRYFMESSTIDLYNASKKVMSGGSFLGGIHTAAAGGVWLIIIKGFAGFKVLQDGVRFAPALPEQWNSISFKLNVNTIILQVFMEKNKITVTHTGNCDHNINIRLYEKEFVLGPGATVIY
ncbi:MAG: glycosyl hydrolase family 65 protein [Bacteroidota bacterium]